ncbi:type VII secretion integral membrane protein EccD [Microbacterium sp. NPDC058342]|uniref:type VII secretion integral membrane protein EccD n=1 Tax=Microbacterium sp. NPDC058342 TaxID=3346454 RepID=UPI00366140DC
MTTLAQTVPSATPGVQSDSALAAAGDMCRLVVIGPTSRVELAVPSHIPVVELLPTIVGHLDPALATRGLAHGGWVLQRLGHAPLDENRSTSAAGLLDGDVLYLRPRGDEMAQAQYDDLVDGVQTALGKRGDEWTAGDTRTAVLVGLVLACVGAAAVTALMGSVAPLVAGVLAAAATGAGALVGRLWDSLAGDILLLGAVAVGAVAGATLPGALFPVPGTSPVAQVMTAAVAVGVVAASGAYARGGLRPVLLAIAGSALVVVLALALPLLLGLSPEAGAAIGVMLLLVAARLVPRLSIWIAGLEIDSVPTSAEEFQTDLDTIATADIAEKSKRLHSVVTAFWVAWSVLLCAAISVLAVAEGWAPLSLAIAGSVATLLQARELRAKAHRTTLLAASALPIILLAPLYASRLELLWQIVILTVLVIAAGYAVVAVRVLPGRRLAPTWGRSGDVLHWLCAIAVPALVLAVTGVYDLIADLF